MRTNSSGFTKLWKARFPEMMIWTFLFPVGPIGSTQLPMLYGDLYFQSVCASSVATAVVC